MERDETQVPSDAAVEAADASAAAAAVSAETAEAAPGAGAPLEESAVELDLAELQVKAAQRDEYLTLAQRTQADFENYRKRMTREVAAAEGRGVTKLAKELLPALDDLERGLRAAGQGNDSHLTEGLRLVHAQLTAALGRLGIEGYAPAGEPFDPNVHEAMAQQAVEGAASGTVVEVYQQGWRMDDLVLRPARVVVAA
jgi:molecular chaperone GrpE